MTDDGRRFRAPAPGALATVSDALCGFGHISEAVPGWLAEMAHWLQPL